MVSDELGELTESALRLGLRLSPEVERRFVTLLDLLVDSGSRLNLTGLRDRGSIVKRHFIESLAIGTELDRRGMLEAGARLVDLGSGAGFPGLPLKLCWPELEVYLLEATGKKARFLETAVESLGLAKTGVLHGRAETLAHGLALRESFDVVIARTVAPLPALVEMALPFLRVGGSLAAAKGSRAHAEIVAAGEALKVCGGELSEYVEAIEGASLGLVIVRKTSLTPERYPRRPGRPSSHPLGERG